MRVFKICRHTLLITNLLLFLLLLLLLQYGELLIRHGCLLAITPDKITVKNSLGIQRV